MASILSFLTLFSAVNHGLSDEFAQEANTWVKQSPRKDAPAPRFSWEGSGAYDPSQDLWIHFGGHDGQPQGNHTFVYDVSLGTWHQRFPNTAPPGVCCVDGSNTFDPRNRCFVAFPGGSLGHGWQWSRSVKLKQSPVWLYDSSQNRWTNMRPPPYKQPAKYSRDVIGGLCSGATFDPVAEIAIAFGGTGAGGATQALFVYDVYSNHLEQIHGKNPPSNRDGMGLAYDSRQDCLIMFGSQYLSDERTWIYRFQTNRWEALSLEPHPPAVKKGTYSTIPRMAYDSINDVTLCVVWLGEENGHETWAFDMNERLWRRMAPPSEPDPSKSRSRNLSFSPKHNVFFLETMAVGGGPQVWTYRYEKRSRTTALCPPADVKIETQPGSATLNWSGAGSQAYTVYRSDADRPWKAVFTRIGTATTPSFVDKGLTRGRVYTYMVKSVGPDGKESCASHRVRTQPHVPARPVVSVLATNRIDVEWPGHSASDVVGYSIYRGLASVDTVTKGTPGAWKDNDPPYDKPVVVGVRDITDLRKLTDRPVEGTAFCDTTVDLRCQSSDPGEYRYRVFAYVIRAVNRLGIESGPSPYALTIPAAVEHLMLREDGNSAELKWRASGGKVSGYHVYSLKKLPWEMMRVTEEPIRVPRFRHTPLHGKTRYWVVPVDILGQEGEPSSPVWYNQRYNGFYDGVWHQ